MKDPTLFKDHAVSSTNVTWVCQLLSSGKYGRGIIKIQMTVCALGLSSFVRTNLILLLFSRDSRAWSFNRGRRILSFGLALLASWPFGSIETDMIICIHSLSRR